jgi:hypothetical protein
MKDFEEIERRMNITNSHDHPTNEMYKVYHFKTEEQALFFEGLLLEKNIQFESDQELAHGKTMYLFGIRKNDIDQVTKLNYIAIGKFRKPFIGNSAFRWFVVLLGISALALALIGFFIKK